MTLLKKQKVTKMRSSTQLQLYKMKSDSIVKVGAPMIFNLGLVR